MSIMRRYDEVCHDGSGLNLIKLSHNNKFGLPRGTYAFIDLYCDNPDCDCQNCLIDIYKVNMNTDVNENGILRIENLPLVTLYCSWKNSLDNWKIEIHESQKNINAKAIALLELFKKICKEKFAKTISQNYSIFKQTIRKNFIAESNLLVNRPKQKIGKNDPCPCGSGKKYKKCCINKKEIW